MKNARSELARLRRLIEEMLASTRPKEIFRMVTAYAGVPLTPAQRELVEYNHSLKNPARVGFSMITIDPQPTRELQQTPEADNDLPN